MVVLMFQVFVAVLATAMAIEAALLLKRACARWRVARTNSIPAAGAERIATDPAPASEPSRVEP